LYTQNLGFNVDKYNIIAKGGGGSLNPSLAMVFYTITLFLFYRESIRSKSELYTSQFSKNNYLLNYVL